MRFSNPMESTSRPIRCWSRPIAKSTPSSGLSSFYAAQPTDYADYFQAAWRYKYRVALKKPHATLATTAVDAKVSPKYLPMVWQILHDQNAVGPVLKLQKMWQALPPPDAAQTGGLRAKCTAMRDFVVKIRAHTAMQFAAPVVAGLPGQSEPLLNWKLKRVCRAPPRQRSQGSAE